MKININNNEITLRFGYGFLRALGNAWGCAGPAAIIDKFTTHVRPLMGQLEGIDADALASAEIKGGFELPFESVDVFVDIITAAAKAQDNGIALNADDVAQFIFENMDVVGGVLREFMASLPRVKDGDAAGKPAPAEVPEAGK